MAALCVADPQTRIITLTDPPVGGLAAIDVRVDIYSALKDDWRTTPTLWPMRFPLRAFGDPIGVEQIGPYVFFDNVSGWRLQPFDLDHELELRGNLVPESAVQGLSVPMWVARPGRTILLATERSSQALTVETGGGADPAVVADAVLDEIVADHMGPGSFGEVVQSLTVVGAAHLSVAYDEVATTLDILVWGTRGGVTMSAPTAMTVTWRAWNGIVMFTLDETDAILTAAGHYAIQNYAIPLLPNQTYSVDVTVTDVSGTVVARRSVVTTEAA